jgi:hypothetical protein
MQNEAGSTEPAREQDDARAKRFLVDECTTRLVLLGGIGNLAHRWPPSSARSLGRVAAVRRSAACGSRVRTDDATAVDGHHDGMVERVVVGREA